MSEGKKRQMSDKRFEKASFDPRFGKLSKKKEGKLKPESRLTSSMKSSKAFTNPIKFDKYGREYKETEKDIVDENNFQDEENEDSQSIASSSTDSYVEGYFDDENIEEKDLWSEEENEEENQVISPDATSRLAAQNFDYRKIKAGDLMVLFHSFKPTNGVIKRVKVYKTQFGKERLEIEQREGPGVFLKGNSEEEDLNGEEQEVLKLREYEKSILKYYFAIIECGTKSTADHIYQNLDESEFELTGMSIKLSFVPDDMKIPNELVEKCNDLPEKINFDKNSFSRALGHTNVDFSWDEPKLERVSLLSKAQELDLEAKELDQVYGGIDGDSEDEIAIEYSENDFSNSPTTLNKSDWRSDFDKKKKKSSGIEITFKSGFDFSYDKQAEKELLQQQKQEENQKQRKSLKKQKKSKKNPANQTQEEDPSLQLLIDSDHSKEGKEFKLDLDDPRFSSLQSSSKFAIDSTSNEYKKGKMENLVKEIGKRKKVKIEYLPPRIVNLVVGRE